MPFGLSKDVISVYDENGTLIKDNIKASVQDGKLIITESADFKVDIGYFVERILTNGFVEKYKVLEPNYCDSSYVIKAHYQMKVINVKSTSNSNSPTVNTIHASGNARIYQNSADHSVNTYTNSQYQEALNKVKSDILDLDLSDTDEALVAKALAKINQEVASGNPSKDKVSVYMEFLPAAVTALDSVIKLGTMFGLN